MSVLANISILYVEDEEGIRNSVSRSLSLITDKIATAENGLEAIEYLDKNFVDLIITDIKMPKMDGLSFIEKIRQEKIETPVIITSAFNETDYFSRAIDLKVDKFINKPIRINHLIDVIKNLSEIIINKRELKTHQQELEYYRQAVEKSNHVIRISNDGSIVEINEELTNYLNSFTNSKFLLSSLEDIFTKKDILEILEYANNFKVLSKIYTLKILDNSFTVILTAFASLLKEDKVYEITIMLNDITKIVKEKDEIIKGLYIDTLTKLPNRLKLFNNLQKDESKYAMLFIDIENFSSINHLYGFKAGDEVLIQMAEILLEYWPGKRPRKVYRTDMDHFIILIDKMDKTERDKTKNFTEMLIKHIEEHIFSINNTIEIELSVTIGASCLGDDDLFTEASIALNVAKSNRVSLACFADLTGVRENFENNLNMQRKIKLALQRDLFVNYYQPIVDINGKLVKYEALIRMIDPDNEDIILSPYHFLDIARQSKSYPLMTRTVIANAFRDFGDGSKAFSINISYDDIANPETTQFLESSLQEHPNADVTIELLESEGLKDFDKTLKFFHQMKGYGAKIAIDDFGSGYSNFTYFFDMPLDILKIDGSLVKRVHEHRGYLALEAIVNFSKHLGVETVAEYVEDEAIFEKLKPLNITMYQGYYFAEPKPFLEL